MNRIAEYGKGGNGMGAIYRNCALKKNPHLPFIAAPCWRRHKWRLYGAIA